MEKLKIIYRKNLKMTAGKIAAQSVHAAIGIGASEYTMPVVVLGLSDRKFCEAVAREDCFVVRDAGWTEVAALTVTCAAYFDE